MLTMTFLFLFPHVLMYRRQIFLYENKHPSIVTMYVTSLLINNERKSAGQLWAIKPVNVPNIMQAQEYESIKIRHL